MHINSLFMLSTPSFLKDTHNIPLRTKYQYSQASDIYLQQSGRKKLKNINVLKKNNEK